MHTYTYAYKQTYMKTHKEKSLKKKIQKDEQIQTFEYTGRQTSSRLEYAVDSSARKTRRGRPRDTSAGTRFFFLFPSTFPLSCLYQHFFSFSFFHSSVHIHALQFFTDIMHQCFVNCLKITSWNETVFYKITIAFILIKYNSLNKIVRSISTKYLLKRRHGH